MEQSEEGGQGPSGTLMPGKVSSGAVSYAKETAGDTEPGQEGSEERQELWVRRRIYPARTTGCGGRRQGAAEHRRHRLSGH